MWHSACFCNRALDYKYKNAYSGERNFHRAAEGAKQGGGCSCCCASIPWLQLLCTIVIIAGLAVFFTFTAQAFGAVNSMLKELQVSISALQVSDAALKALLGIAVAVVFFIAILSLVAAVSTAIGKARRYNQWHGVKGGCLAGCAFKGSYPLQCCSAATQSTLNSVHACLVACMWKSGACVTCSGVCFAAAGQGESTKHEVRTAAPGKIAAHS